MVKLFLLATAVLIPKFKFLLCMVCCSIYSSFVLNYLPSRMLAVFALCHFLGGAFANFDATRGLGICQPRGARPPLGFSYDHGTQIQLNIENTKRFFFLQILLKKYIEQYVLRILAFLPFTLRQMAVYFFFRQQYSRLPSFLVHSCINGLSAAPLPEREVAIKYRAITQQ